MKNFLIAFRDLKQSKDLNIKNAKIIYLKGTGWVCFWFFTENTIKRLTDAEIVC